MIEVLLFSGISSAPERSMLCSEAESARSMAGKSEGASSAEAEDEELL